MNVPFGPFSASSQSVGLAGAMSSIFLEDIITPLPCRSRTGSRTVSNICCLMACPSASAHLGTRRIYNFHPNDNFYYCRK
jgi:hypothetical protein